jgi:hypothetical protein
MRGLVLFFWVLLFSVVGNNHLFSQEVRRINTSNQRKAEGTQKSTVATEQASYPQTISKKQGEEQVLHDKAYYESEILRLKENLRAIDLKVASVKNDPIAHEEAMEIGWYEQMESTKKMITEQLEAFELKVK